MDLKNKKNIKVYKDGFNEIIFKPNTKKVVIGINIFSWNGSKHKSFKCKNAEEAKNIGFEYINKFSRVKIKTKNMKKKVGRPITGRKPFKVMMSPDEGIIKEVRRYAKEISEEFEKQKE